MSKQPNKVINFMAVRRVMAVLCGVLILASLAAVWKNGLVFGFDFTGGTQAELIFETAPDLEELREKLNAAGFENPVVMQFGSERDILVRMQDVLEAGGSERILEVLGGTNVGLEIHRLELVGPQVGEELRDAGGLGLLAALLVIMFYVAIRFQYKFAVGTVVGLIFDVIITLGIFTAFRLEFDLTVLAAFLAVIAYSLNDTIVVFDRIRENFRIIREGSVIDVMNESMTQVLERTIITSLTTLLVLFVLLFLGGEMVRNFSIVLIIGIVVGTFSTLFVSSVVTLIMNIQREDLLPPKRAEEEEHALP